MNRRQFCGTLAGTSLLAAGSWELLGGAPPAAKETKPAETIDMLAKLKQWNSDKYAAPPTQFRAGHVTPRPLDAKAITKKANGFTIQLPSGAPVPTPSVYKGKLFVSGGFHSKEFYCFDAVKGDLVWGVNLDDDGPTAAACDDDICVFNTESCTIFAIDCNSGKQLWSYWLGDPLTSTPAIANGVVFTSYPASGRGGQFQNQGNAPEPQQIPKNIEKPDKVEKPAPPCSHVLAALDLKTGKILWQRWIDSDVMSAPVAVDKELYISTFAGVVCRFSQVDGSILAASQSRATCAPVVVGKNVFYTKRVDNGKKAEEAIANYGRYDGKQNYEAGKRDAAYLDHQVQARSAQKGEAMKLDASNGFPGGAPGTANPDAALKNVGQDNVWSMQAFQGSRLLNLGGRNVNCMGDEVVCTDPATGKMLWTYKLDGDLKKQGGFLGAPPAAAGGMVFLATLTGEVLQMDSASGKVTKTWKLGAPTRFQPVLDGGRIYAGTQDGKVVCIDTGDAKLTGWPCWGGNAAHTGVPDATK